MEFEPQYDVSDAKKFLKENAGKIIAVIVILGVIYFAYDFFIGSIREVNIYVKDYEKEPIENSQIKIIDSSGHKVFEKEGSSYYLVNLRKGSYIVEVSATGFKKATETIEVSEDSSITIKLEKDLPLEIISLEFPERLFLGQEFTASAYVKNTGNYSSKPEVLLEDALEEFTCELDRVIVGAHSTEEVKIFCKVPSGILIKGSCEQKTAKARIKYLASSEQAKFELCNAPEIALGDVSFSVNPVSMPKQKKDISIKNNAKFEIEGTELSIEIVSATKNAPEEIKSWLAFTRVTSEPRYKRALPAIGAKETVYEPLEITLPPWARAETVYGNIVLNAPFLNEPIKSDLVIKITKEAKVQLKPTISPSKISIYERDGQIDEQTVKLTITNQGDLKVENLDVIIENSGECTQEWLKPLKTLSIAEIDAKKSAIVALIASAPSSVPQNTTMRCILSLSYENPLPPNDIKVQDIGFIEITKK